MRSRTGLRVASDAALLLEELALGQKQLIVLLIPRRIRLRDSAAKWPRRIDEGLEMVTVRVKGWQQKERAGERISDDLSSSARR